MRLDRLRLTGFKNLTDLEIDFDQAELSTVLIGENGTGKSNVIEALVTIFRDVDLGTHTPFPYSVAYRCHGLNIEIDNRIATSGTTIKVDDRPLSRPAFVEQRNTLLPDNVFGYYSGASRRLEQLFDAHPVPLLPKSHRARVCTRRHRNDRPAPSVLLPRNIRAARTSHVLRFRIGRSARIPQREDEDRRLR